MIHQMGMKLVNTKWLRKPIDESSDACLELVFAKIPDCNYNDKHDNDNGGGDGNDKRR
jgi:hypothetical protein